MLKPSLKRLVVLSLLGFFVSMRNFRNIVRIVRDTAERDSGYIGKCGSYFRYGSGAKDDLDCFGFDKAQYTVNGFNLPGLYCPPILDADS